MRIRSFQRTLDGRLPCAPGPRGTASTVKEQLAMLEGVLKDDQIAWLSSMVAEKEDLRSKVRASAEG